MRTAGLRRLIGLGASLIGVIALCVESGALTRTTLRYSTGATREAAGRTYYGVFECLAARLADLPQAPTLLPPTTTGDAEFWRQRLIELGFPNVAFTADTHEAIRSIQLLATGGPNTCGGVAMKIKKVRPS